MLNIYAGERALTSIKENGFSPDLFTTLLGASGGPKWFVLCALDKFLFGEFFKNRTAPLNLIGSSVGSFRAACFAQPDAVGAIERLAKQYIETTYSKKYVSPGIVTESGRKMLMAMLDADGISAILTNPVFKAHFIAAKAQGWAASENRLLQGMSLLKSSRNNRKRRSLLTKQYERVIFQPHDSQLVIDDPHGFKTQHVTLTRENTVDAILASGSLPVIMQGISNIADTPTGVYRDGGIIDYHFDFNVDNPGLILYPHFSSSLKAGWFDKKLQRRVKAEHYDRVVLLCPSDDAITKLPHGKIPDRSDFKQLGNKERMDYWWQVVRETEQMATDFFEFWHRQDINRIQPISQLTD